MASARYVIAASPLVKCYLKEWHDSLLENPDLIYDMATPFSFDVPRGCSAFKVDFNKPMAVRGADDKQIETLFGWLTGESGQSYHETDIYGLVSFDPGVDLVDRVDQMAFLEALATGDPAEAVKAKKELDKIQKDTATRIQEMRAKVKIASELRVKRAMKTVHNNLIRQWAINKEQNLGKYPPSISEAVGAHALDKELKAKAEKGKALLGRIDTMMAETSA